MKNITTSLLIILLFVAGCKEAEPALGESCSVKLPGIHFIRSLNGAAGNSKLEGDLLRLNSDAKKDYFNDPDGKLSNQTAPVLLAEVDNTKPFTLQATLSPVFKDTYDAAALYIFSTAQLWQKFAFEMDEAGRKRIVSVRTIKTSDDNNHDILTTDTVHLKISSDTKTVGFYYSTDKVKWNLARLYSNNYPARIWVGVSTQSPVGQGTTAIFKDCILEEKAVRDFRIGL